MRIEIATDDAATRLLADATFVADWRALAGADQKLTLLQEPDFALPWYRAYAETHAPLLVQGRSASGELLGLLPLAREARVGTVVHAGAHQAEYHGWLARAGHDDEFIVRALLELRRVLGFASWSWRWLPPRSPTAWIASPELRTAGIRIVSEARPAPVWDLRERDKLDKILASSSIRPKANRYRRRGEFRLERIRDPARARELMPVLSRQCDYRQEVIHAVRPFADDPRKARFFVERLSFPEANHFSVLWCGDEPLAFHHGAYGRRTCLLGLTAYSPAESRNSPGTLLLAELARMLTADGCHELDLTPGTDPYKLRFANQERTLCRVTLHASRYRGWKSRVIVAARRRVLAAVAGHELEAQEKLQRTQRELGLVARDLGRGRVAGLARRAREGLWAKSAYACFRHEGLARATLADAPAVRVQAYEELLEYERGKPFASRRDLLADALERFSGGETLYSVRDGGRLAQIAWRASTPAGPLADELRRRGVLREGASLFHAFYGLCEPRSLAAFTACLQRMLLDCADAPGIVLCLERNDAEQRAAAERLGFRADCVAVRRRILGRPWSWRLEGLALAGEHT